MYTFDPTISSVVAGDLSGAATEPPPEVLGRQLVARMHRYWHAANYLTVGQISFATIPSSAGG